MFVQDTGTELMPQDIKYYQDFGGEKVVFEKEETTEMKKLMEKGRNCLPLLCTLELECFFPHRFVSSGL